MPIRTERLLLRPLRPEDAPALAEAIADYDIVKWLSRVPWPYRLSDAEAFVSLVLEEGQAEYAVTEAGRVLGVIGTGNELGYWLRRDVQGRGIATEAAVAVTQAHFATGASRLVSGHHPDNAASRRVLEKLGFVDTHRVEKDSLALGRVTIQRMELTAERWRSLRQAAQ